MAIAAGNATHPREHHMIDRVLSLIRDLERRSRRAIRLATAGLAGLMIIAAPPVTANPGGAGVQLAFYSSAYRDRAHGPLPDGVVGSYDPSPWFGGSTGLTPRGVSRYFGSASSGVDPTTLRQFTQADVTSVHTPYFGGSFAGPWPSSSDPMYPTYYTAAAQIYAFKVIGGTPGDTVTVQMEATVQASGSSNFFAGASVSFADHAGSMFGIPLYSLSQAFAVSASDGVGVGAPWIAPSPSPQHTFALLSGSLSGTGTIAFDVVADQEYLIWLDAIAATYDQEGSSAHAFADPVISISPSTPNAGQYAVVQSNNIAGVPEIDPASLGSVIALLSGTLGLLERRRHGRT